MTTGERLTNLRNKIGYSQEQMAEQLGVKRSTYAKWEKDANKPSRQIDNIAAFFHVSTDYILCRTDDPTPPASGSQRDDGTGSLSALSAREQAHISKYRVLSDASKDAIDNQTDYFYQREQSLEESSQTGNAS